jgi:cold shock CspA family protein
VARGTVSAFDERAGLGEVTADDATVYPFHCTVIADGSRTIEVGANVDFEIVPGPLGQWEAAQISPVRAGS